MTRVNYMCIFLGPIEPPLAHLHVFLRHHPRPRNEIVSGKMDTNTNSTDDEVFVPYLTESEFLRLYNQPYGEITVELRREHLENAEEEEEAEEAEEVAEEEDLDDDIGEASEEQIVSEIDDLFSNNGASLRHPQDTRGMSFPDELFEESRLGRKMIREHGNRRIEFSGRMGKYPNSAQVSSVQWEAMRKECYKEADKKTARRLANQLAALKSRAMRKRQHEKDIENLRYLVQTVSTIAEYQNRMINYSVALAKELEDLMQKHGTSQNSRATRIMHECEDLISVIGTNNQDVANELRLRGLVPVENPDRGDGENKKKRRRTGKRTNHIHNKP